MLSKPKPKYRVFPKNHAVGIGGYARRLRRIHARRYRLRCRRLREFMPAGEDGTVDASQMRRLQLPPYSTERDANHIPPKLLSNYSSNTVLPYHIMPRQLPLALPSTSGALRASLTSALEYFHPGLERLVQGRREGETSFDYLSCYISLVGRNEGDY
ncbi:hypothetical protein HAX54_009995 [Datura stramonium]|uniref:Uncharacterized protein n=1 Tax=Datura stramonium TaxID=4076 RepID=A0ABS8TH02_DATST|nr:hypothetical protein [Datura stramonium]